MMAATNWLEASKLMILSERFLFMLLQEYGERLAVGLFSSEGGLFTGGGWHLLGIQILGLVVLCVWGFALTWVGLKVINIWIPIRSTDEEQELGLDISYHGTMATHTAPEFIRVEEYYRQVESLERKI